MLLTHFNALAITELKRWSNVIGDDETPVPVRLSPNTHIHSSVCYLQSEFNNSVRNYISASPIWYLPSKLIVELIAEAKNRILSLPDDWDGEGSSKFQETTFALVENFLYRLSFESNFITQCASDIQILPSCEGSIDLYWETDKFKLIVVFREDYTYSYFGATRRRQHIIQGQDLPSVNEIADWVKERWECNLDV